MNVASELLGEGLKSALDALGVDGWFIYDFHGNNPVARRLLGFEGMATRRLFVLLRKDGRRTAIVHRIETHLYDDFPGELIQYSSSEDLMQAVRQTVNGLSVAMEISRNDAVPYLDRVPVGVVELVERCGARVCESQDLVTRFAAVWSESELKEHSAAAEIIAGIARDSLQELVNGEHGAPDEVQFRSLIVDRMKAAGLYLEDLPIVAFGENSSNPHHEPGHGPARPLGPGDVVLLDLWGGLREGAVFADQTWIAYNGGVVPEEVARVWGAVSGARDAVLERVRSADSGSMTGFELDAIARAYIGNQGFAAYFTHRTGHSIDVDLHGSGPHLDSFETHDHRKLLVGVGFSVEPGVYLPGKFGVRSEVNVHLGVAGPVATPSRLQSELILAV